jgi:hypothetical protein
LWGDGPGGDDDGLHPQIVSTIVSSSPAAVELFRMVGLWCCCWVEDEEGSCRSVVWVEPPPPPPPPPESCLERDELIEGLDEELAEGSGAATNSVNGERGNPSL